MKKKSKILEELEKLAHLVPAAFYWVAADTTILGGNKLAFDMIKEVSSSCKDIIGKNAFDMFPKDAAEELVNNNKKTIRARKSITFEETVIDVKTKKTKFRNVIRTPLYENGKLVCILILLNDITEIKEKTKLALDKQIKFQDLVNQTAYEFKSPLAILLILFHECSGKSKDKVFETLDTLAELIPTPVYWFDENNVLLSSNKWDSESVGGRFIGKTPFDYFPFEIANNLVKNNKTVMKTGKILSYDEQLSNNQIHRSYKAPLYDDRGQAIGVLGTSINVTMEKNAERLKLENELQKVKLKEQERYEMLVTQLAHDIRSPSASLSMTIDSCKNILPEKERMILTGAADRITDIANNLLKGYKKHSMDNEKIKQQKVLVSLALSSIVSEKREQYINSSTVIKSNYEPNCEFLFIKASLMDFERMISNLVNNSFEAIENKKGEINLTLSQKDKYIQITITDNGKGMSQNVIDKIMNNIVVTVNKKDGSGIGFTQVRETLNISNGRMEITSVVGEGTKISLFFPIVDTPEWIAKQISLFEKSAVVVIDDDPSIHDAWDLRFKDYQEKIHLEHFDHGEKAIDFINSFPKKNNIFLLADFELIDQNLNGLQIIKQTSMAKQAILVTSHYNRPNVLKTASKSKIKILPKQLALSIPIEIKEKKIEKKIKKKYKEVDLVVLDDENIFADSLADFFRTRSFTVDAYYDPKELLKKISQYDKGTRIFIDNNLRFNITGIELAKKLHKDGYDKLYILSGTDFEKDEIPNYLTAITKGDLNTLNELIAKFKK